MVNVAFFLFLMTASYAIDSFTLHEPSAGRFIVSAVYALVCSVLRWLQEKYIEPVFLRFVEKKFPALK